MTKKKMGRTETCHKCKNWDTFTDCFEGSPHFLSEIVHCKKVEQSEIITLLEIVKNGWPKIPKWCPRKKATDTVRERGKDGR